MNWKQEVRNLIAGKTKPIIVHMEESNVDYFDHYIWPKMTSEEQSTYIKNCFCGMVQGNIILMGSEALFRYDNFRKKMIAKYRK